MRMLLGRSLKALLLFPVLLLAVTAEAAFLLGDLDGSGIVDSQDEAWLVKFYGAKQGEANYAAAADGNSDGVIDYLDLALFGSTFGASGGYVDTSPPQLFVTLNDIPDDMNDLLVVPPDGFQITIDLDDPAGGGGSVIDLSTLVITSDQAIGPLSAGSDLAPSFSTSQMDAVWEIPAGSDLARTSHYLTVSVSDAAGNSSAQVYGFAVRDHPVSGAPLASTQTVFLDFDQDRSLGPDLDFLEDLRTFGLSSANAPTIELQMRDWIVLEIGMRVHGFFGRNPDGSAGPVAVNMVFATTEPGGIRSRLCVGGTSTLGSAYLGAAILDENNVNPAQDECSYGPIFGVFPQAIDNLWGGEPEYLAAFSAVHPGLGGTPIGEHALDASVLAAGFDPLAASAAELQRWNEISDAVDAFSQVLATAAAHESGHLVGLVAHGAPPGGLHGGTSGGNYDHNVTPTGATPNQSYLMNHGGSFSFAEMTGRSGELLPIFRELNWAYLHNRLVLDGQVTGLYPAPEIVSVIPSSVDLSGGAVSITVNGDYFLATPTIELVEVNDPTPNEVLGVTQLNPQTLTGSVDPLLVQPALYDVVIINPDGQSVSLPGGLLVQ